jgi:hypothetical protein
MWEVSTQATGTMHCTVVEILCCWYFEYQRSAILSLDMQLAYQSRID